MNGSRCTESVSRVTLSSMKAHSESIEYLYLDVPDAGRFSFSNTADSGVPGSGQLGVTGVGGRGLLCRFDVDADRGNSI